jgi:transglutaminase-like putative cysteine protease
MSRPPFTTQPYRGTANTVDNMVRLAMGPRGGASPELRLFLEDLIRRVRPRDKLSLMATVYTWFMARYHYVWDPVDNEYVKDPMRVLEEVQEHGIFVGDCDDAATFLTACLRCLGIPARPMRVGFKAPPNGRSEGPYTHVLCVAKDQYKRTVVLDPVAHHRTQSMLGRIKQAA